LEASQLAGGFRVHYRKISDKQHLFRIDLNDFGDAISLQTYKDWVAVNVKASKPENFVGTKGLVGSYPSGDLVARDGVTVMTDTDAFGKEWQVLADEAMLFHEDGEVTLIGPGKDEAEVENIIATLKPHM
jgi:hypothetical protein